MAKTPVQRGILVDLTVFGADKASNIAQRTGYHRNTVSKHLGILSRESMVREKGDGVYELTTNGLEAGRGLIRAGDLPYQDSEDSS